MPGVPQRNKGGRMPVYSLAKAAAASGRSRSTILRALQSGRLSAVHDATTGAWAIDGAELARVYPPIPGRPGHGPGGGQAGDAALDRGAGRGQDRIPGRGGDMGGGDATALLFAKDALIAEMQAASRLRDDTIADLRARLDAAEARLDRLLLTDQRLVAPSAPARRSWWRWGR
jgi:hypothetical protein